MKEFELNQKYEMSIARFFEHFYLKEDFIREYHSRRRDSDMEIAEWEQGKDDDGKELYKRD